jgi:hypothetical protein
MTPLGAPNLLSNPIWPQFPSSKFSFFLGLPFSIGSLSMQAEAILNFRLRFSILDSNKTGKGTMLEKKWDGNEYGQG